MNYKNQELLCEMKKKQKLQQSNRQSAMASFIFCTRSYSRSVDNLQARIVRQPKAAKVQIGKITASHQKHGQAYNFIYYDIFLSSCYFIVLQFLVFLLF